MKINILRYSLVLIPLILAGCGSDCLDTDEKAPGLYLTAEVPGADYIVSTKAGQAGVSDLNENVLNNVYYFLYPLAGSAEAKPSLFGHFSDLATETQSTGRMNERYIPIGASAVNELFPSGTQDCRVVVVANPDSTLVQSLEKGPRLDSLRALVVTADFTKTTKQNSFVMVFDSLATVSARTASTVCEVKANLKRLASKLTISATVKDGFEDPTYGWYVPECSGIKVTFVNGFSRTNLLGDFSGLTTADDDWFSSAEIGFGTATHDNTNSVYTCSATAPIYTYPMEWEFSDKHEPYLLVEIPWRNAGSSKDSGTGTVTSYYYKMMLSTKEITSNNWLDINLKLSILGSPNKVEPTQQYLYENYQVYDWNEAYESIYNNVNADIRQARYLVVPQTAFVLNNQETWNIPFTTSHDCEIVNATYTTWDYSSNDAVMTSAAALSGLTKTCTISISDGVITFNHPLRNDTSGAAGTYDFAPYYFTFTIRHKDDYTFSQTITVTQYPALYITAELNSSGQLPGYDDATITYTTEYNNILHSNATVYLNNQVHPSLLTPVSGYNEDIQEIGGDPHKDYAGVGSNRNGNMYTIHISALSSGDTRIIGDPRVTTVDNLPISSQNWSADNAAALYGSTPRQLTYYYPSGTTDYYANTISPSFRIASSWGNSNAMTFENAERRCAAYQEDGYPAGRWRVPTKAEFEYICKLSSDHVIPYLFGSLSNTSTAQTYWCNSGYFGATADGNSPVYHDTYTPEEEYYPTVRCVYDDWYWESTDSYVQNTVTGSTPTVNGRLTANSTTAPKYSVFVWGDMPR